MGWWGTSYVIGGFLATIITTWFVTGPLAKQYSWMWGAVGPAILLLAAAGAFHRLIPGSGARRAGVAGPSLAAWGEVLQSPALRSIAGAYFCLKLIRYTFLFWLPLYMVERLQYGNARAGYASSVYELVGLIGVPLAGYLSDRAAGGRRFPVGIAMMVALAAACLFFPQLAASGALVNLGAIGLIGILTFGPDTLLAGAATQDATHGETTATAAGFVNGAGSLGQMASPLVVAGAVQWFGWDGLFQVFAWMALLGAAALALQWKNDPGIRGWDGTPARRMPSFHRALKHFRAIVF